MNRIFLFFTLILASNLTAMDKFNKTPSQKNPVIKEIKSLARITSDMINEKCSMMLDDQIKMPKDFLNTIAQQTKQTEELIEQHIQQNNQYIYLPDSLKRTPLIHATIYMQSSIVALLLKFNASTNNVDCFNKTAIDYARETFKKLAKAKDTYSTKYTIDKMPLFGYKEFKVRKKDIKLCLQFIHKKHYETMQYKAPRQLFSIN